METFHIIARDIPMPINRADMVTTPSCLDPILNFDLLRRISASRLRRSLNPCQPSQPPAPTSARDPATTTTTTPTIRDYTEIAFLGCELQIRTYCPAGKTIAILLLGEFGLDVRWLYVPVTCTASHLRSPAFKS
jgi:hypothetical protein